MKYVPIIDGGRSQFERLPLDRAAERLAAAHAAGLSWDCRVAGSGASYRPLTEAEAVELVSAVSSVVRQSN